MSLAGYVRTLGRGLGRARHLTRAEAADAMGQILVGTAEPEATGALLMLMRYRSEDAAEIAGFVDAIRAASAPAPAAAVDWPTYAAGRSRGLPWFLLAAKLVAEGGTPVLLHGWAPEDGPSALIRQALGPLGIRIGTGAPEPIAYLPLEDVAPEALRVLRLREVLGLRSPINTALRLLNPSAAPVSLQGVFHPPYRALQAEAAALLNQPSQLVLKGAGGEFERAPAKTVALLGRRAGTPIDTRAPALLRGATGRLAEGPEHSDPAALPALWAGEIADPYAEAIVTGTAALALFALGTPLAEADDKARALWAARRRPRAA